MIFTNFELYKRINLKHNYVHINSRVKSCIFYVIQLLCNTDLYIRGDISIDSFTLYVTILTCIDKYFIIYLVMDCDRQKQSASHKTVA